jgi:pyruvate dehydrogenase E1 component alpha subunit
MSSLDPPTATSIYRRMALIRAGEDRIIRGLTSGEFAFTYYPVRGHEAIAASLGEVLRPDDHLSATYRCFHDIVAKGAPLREIVSEQMGKVTGTSKGKGGPMHISDPRSGLMVTTGVVGAGVPIAVGLALAAKLDGSDRVAVATFGDGATSIGATHEAMNLAALWELPLILLCQNNMYGEHTPLAEYTKTERLADRAAAYGMPGVTVDGRKPQELYPALSSAVERARTGGGPTFIEARTYRILAHSFGTDQSYQPKEELDRARQNEPVQTYRTWLLSEGCADGATLDAIDREVSEIVEDAIEFAKASPQPGLDELLVDVFASTSEVPV